MRKSGFYVAGGKANYRQSPAITEPRPSAEMPFVWLSQPLTAKEQPATGHRASVCKRHRLPSLLTSAQSPAPGNHMVEGGCSLPQVS